MSRVDLSRYVTPWKYKRLQREAEQVRALKLRDGEHCARCRRPMRFDLPRGHDQAARLEAVVSTEAGAEPDLGNLRLTHVRCNASGVDHTGEVTERMRRKSEAELFAKAKKRKRA